jgi:hypothetical protein
MGVRMLLFYRLMRECRHWQSLLLVLESWGVKLVEVRCVLECVANEACSLLGCD